MLTKLRKGEQPPVALRVPEQACRRMIEALNRVAGAGQFDVAAHRRLWGHTFEVTYRANVPKRSQARGEKSVVAYDIEVELPERKGSFTRLTVKFGTRARPDGTDAWIGVQGNTSTLMSGQNTWPTHHAFTSTHRDKVVMQQWPFFVVLAICRAADPSFKAPPSMIKSLLRGEATYQNVQFAAYMPIKQDAKTLTLDLICARFRSLTIKAREGDEKLEAFDNGRMFGISAERYPVPDANGRETCSGALLQKWFGPNKATTVVVYDKAQQQRLDGRHPDWIKLENLLRFDITMRQGCLAKLFTEVQWRSKKRRAPVEFTLNASKKVIANAANIVTAITFMDDHYWVRTNGRKHRGFRAWLIKRVLNDWFHLRELFSYSEKRWRRVEKWMAKWAAKDRRYRLAFTRWRAAEFGKDTSLRNCIVRAGLSADAAEARLKELKRYGLSGEVPRKYWLNLDETAMAWGATYDETEQLRQRRRANKPISDLLARRQERIKTATVQVRKALTGLQQAAALPVAPMAGELTNKDGVVERLVDLVDPLPAPASSKKSASIAKAADGAKAKVGSSRRR